MMMRRDVFDAVGGFDEKLAVAYNDVDLCLKIGRLGKHIVYTPCATLVHHEGASRGNRAYPRQERLFWDRWKAVIQAGDPHYNPNLSLSAPDWRLRG